jgi:TolA-binding protein
VKQKESLGEQEKRPKETLNNPRRDQMKEGQSAKSAAPADKAAGYEAAYNAFKNKRYREAREKFEAFVKQSPKDELADNAHFWIGETYYGEKDFEGAILAYETFLKKYPNSE